MAGSTNFIQQNPTQANQETDSAYQSDSLTTGGVGVDATMSSAWLNKYFYQQSTFVAAFCQMMANKGYTLSDSSITTLEAVLANVLTNADQKPPLVTVPYSATPTLDCNTANGFIITLSGNVTGASLVNMQIGQIVSIIVQQNGSGGFTFAAPSAITSGQWWPIDTGANSFTCQQFIKTPSGNVVRVDTSELDLQAAVNAINSTLSTVNGEISTLQGQVSTLNSEVATINSEISGINSTITTLQGNVNSLTSTVSGLSSQVSNLNTIVNPIPGEITTLQSQVSGLLAAFANSIGTNGYQKFENGLILQWGQVYMGGGGTVSATFPINFPNACLCVVAATYGTIDRITYVESWSNSGVSIGNNGSGVDATFIAIGY